MKKLNLILKYIRNGFLILAALVVAFTVVLGMLMTNSEIKFMSIVSGYLVLSAIFCFILQIFVVLIHKDKRGVTYK